MQNINRFLYAMNEGGSGAQRILGDAVANDVLFTKMLDRVINPKGITDSGEPFIKKKYYLLYLEIILNLQLFLKLKDQKMLMLGLYLVKFN